MSGKALKERAARLSLSSKSGHALPQRLIVDGFFDSPVSSKNVVEGIRETFGRRWKTRYVQTYMRKFMDLGIIRAVRSNGDRRNYWVIASMKKEDALSEIRSRKGSQVRSQPVGIEYHGVPGASQECKDAVMRLIQCAENITEVRILTSSNTHCLVLTISGIDRVAIKSGFSSGYGGEGPRSFSCVLQLLAEHGAKIDECEVENDLIERLDASALTISDMELIETAKSIRPTRWRNFILDDERERAHDGSLWREFPPVIPFGLIDQRIIDLATSFGSDPDAKLLKGYRRLEDIVRERTGIGEHGARLFSQAYGGPSPSLRWQSVSEGERTGRINLFTGAYMAHRNPRAHRELKSVNERQLEEFLLLNHLYLLENDSE